MASKYATPEEAHRARSEAGRRGAERCKALGHCNGGRPKGSKNKIQNPNGKNVTMKVREGSLQIFTILARAAGVSTPTFMAQLAQAMKAKNAHLFDTPKDEVIL